MERRDFLKKSALAGAGLMATQVLPGKMISGNAVKMNEENSIFDEESAARGKSPFELRKIGGRKVSSIGLGTVCPRLGTEYAPVHHRHSGDNQVLAS